MQIDRVIYPIETLGPGKRVGIWTIGCEHKCNKCSNPELWEEDCSKEITVKEIVSKINEQCNKVEGVTITGGDPFYQADELFKLLKELRKNKYTDILVYTGYDYDEIKDKHQNILKLIDVLIDGKYIDNLNDNKGIRGSSNQNVIILNEGVKTKYFEVNYAERKRQNFVSNGKIISVGIPIKTEEGQNEH